MMKKKQRSKLGEKVWSASTSRSARCTWLTERLEPFWKERFCYHSLLFSANFHGRFGSINWLAGQSLLVFPDPF